MFCDIGLSSHSWIPIDFKLGSNMTITFSKDEDDSSEQLNDYIHNLLGYHTKENKIEAWNSIPHSNFLCALRAIVTFKELFVYTFIASRWQSKIQTFWESISLDPLQTLL